MPPITSSMLLNGPSIVFWKHCQSYCMDPHKRLNIPSMVLNGSNTFIKSFLMLLDEPAHIAKSVVGVIERAHRRFMARF